MNEFFIKIGNFLTRTYYLVLTTAQNNGPTSWYNPPDWYDDHIKKNDRNNEDPFKIYSDPKYINFRKNKLSEETSTDLIAFSESPKTPNFLDWNNVYSSEIRLSSVILPPPPKLTPEHTLLAKFFYDKSIEKRSAIWEAASASCKKHYQWRNVEYLVAKVLREEQTILSLSKTGLLENEKAGSENLEKFMKFPKHNVLGESTGYDKRWVTESTAILPPKSEKYDPQYVSALQERTSLRATRLMLTLNDNAKEAEIHLFKLIENYYKVDAFEKTYLFGMKRPCARPFFCESIEVTNPEAFIARTFGHWPDYGYRRACILEAYSVLNLPETLIIGEQEGVAVEHDPSSEMAGLWEIACDSVQYLSFWDLITIGTLATAFYLSRRSEKAAELINEIKDL